MNILQHLNEIQEQENLINQKKEDLIKKYTSLTNTETVISRVMRYKELLDIKTKIIPEEKFWLLAYTGMETIFKDVSEDSIFFRADAICQLELNIPDNFK